MLSPAFSASSPLDPEPLTLFALPHCSKPWKGYYAQPTESNIGVSKGSLAYHTGIYNPNIYIAKSCKFAVARAKNAEIVPHLQQDAVYLHENRRLNMMRLVRVYQAGNLRDYSRRGKRHLGH